MRFERLHLKAYGPFQDAVLRLDAPAAGLQVIYGPNERGKSTALRAIGALLYGFPEQTDDRWDRDYAAMRVGAVLTAADRRIALMRRKGRRGTLFEFDPASGAELPGRPVDEAVLEGWLGGVDERRFRLMYGLDAERLREGGRELLTSGSALGAALFEAASGVHRLRAVSAALAAQADALFVPRGQNRVLNAALAEAAALQDAARQAGLPAREWQARQEALAAALAEVGRLESALHERRTRLAHAQRLLGLQPQVAELRRLRAGLEALGPAPPLPPDAAARFAAAVQARDASAQSLADGQARLRALAASMAAEHVSAVHLEAADAIAQLAGRLEEIDAVRVEQARLRADADAARAGLVRLLAALGDASGPDARDDDAIAGRAAAWLPSRAVVIEARQLISRRREREGRREAARESLVQAGRLAAEAQAALRADGEPADLSALAAAGDAATAAGDPEQRASHAGARLDAADRHLARLADALGGPSADALARLECVPAPEVERALAGLAAQAAARAGVQARREAPLARLPELLAQRDARLRGAALVDAAALDAARQARDALLLADPPAPGRDAHRAALAAAVAEADRLADARFADASRIVELESLQSRIDELRRTLARCDDEAARLEAEVERDARAWAQRLARHRLPALAPDAYREWAAQHARLLDALREREALAADVQAAHDDVARHHGLLGAALRAAGLAAPAGAGLAATLAFARARVQAAGQHAQSHARLRADLDRAQQALVRERAALDDAQAELAGADAAWARVAGALRLPADASPARIEAQLDELDGLREALAATERGRRDLRVADERIGLFRADVAAFAERLGVPVPEAGAEPAFVSAARVALRASERARDALLRMRAESDALDASCATAQRRLDDAQGVLTVLRTQADAADDAALEAAVALEQRRQALLEQAGRLDAVVRAATGAQHDALVAQAEAADAAALRAECATLEAAIALEGAARDAALAERSRAQAAVDAADGGPAAAHAAEAVRERLAACARLAADCARLRLAKRLLDEAVARHQQRAQGPLLGAASRWFARLTAGRWSSLHPDWREDAQILVAQDAAGLRLPVERLSEGARDALFLALRMAAIEVRLAASPPVPLLLDDVLMSFDDERAGLALQSLAELGRANQVVYFTHHAHLVALARTVLPPDAVAVNELVHRPIPAPAEGD